MVHLQALPGRRCAHEGAVPAGGTLLAGVVRFRRRSPGERGQQRGGAQPAPNGGEPEDQRRDPFGAGKRNQEYPRFLVRRMALARLQPLPCPELHPLPTPTRPSLNSYRLAITLVCRFPPAIMIGLSIIGHIARGDSLGG